MAGENQGLCVMQGITKIYPNGIIANADASFRLREGEIHALIGENGAGKTTLMKILFGMEKPDAGQILMRGRPVSIASPTDAIRLGIGMVQQHYQLVPSLTVAENLVLGREPHRGAFFDRKQSVAICTKMSELYELRVEAEKPVQDISVSEKQKVEILKALLGGAKILILDEPTAVLTPQEIVEFFIQLKKLREKGHTIVFISHRLSELFEICDRMTVMRDGRTLGVYETAGCDEQMLSRLMVGREVALKVAKDDPRPTRPVLQVRSLTLAGDAGRPSVDSVSFSVRRGEIVGIAAVEGNGQKELIEAITGFRPCAGGSIRFDGQEVRAKGIDELRRRGLGYISEDRSTIGAALAASIRDNLIALEYRSRRLSRRFFFRTTAVADFCLRLITQFEIRCRGAETPLSMLSGGNMQKVIIARELDRNLLLLVAQQPTRGVDVGSIEFIHRNLVRKRDEGCAILLVSADLSEVLSLSDALIVMQGGRISAYFPSTRGLSEEEVGYYMLGVKRQGAEEIQRAYHED